MRRRNLARAAAVLLGFAFLGGIYLLFDLRFEVGSAWPMFSTFRPDPLGAKALYESIALQPGVTVERNTHPLANLHGSGTTLFLLGIAPRKGPFQEQLPGLEQLADEGARVVVAFVPAWPSRVAAPSKADAPFEKQLGLAFHWEISDARTSSERFDELPRHTALWFADLAKEWSVVRTWHDHPVLIERSWKRGSLVLVADSWMLSNDALAERPDAPALAALVGPNRRIVFDENHLGIEDTGSVAGLMRRYRLEGIIAALLALAGLFIWKNASSFPPRAPASQMDAPGLRGYSSAQGLVCLLERSIPARELARVCAEEYRASGRETGRVEETLLAASRDADPLRAYAGVRKTIEETRHPWKQSSKG